MREPITEILNNVKHDGKSKIGCARIAGYAMDYVSRVSCWRTTFENLSKVAKLIP